MSTHSKSMHQVGLPVIARPRLRAQNSHRAIPPVSIIERDQRSVTYYLSANRPFRNHLFTFTFTSPPSGAPLGNVITSGRTSFRCRTATNRPASAPSPSYMRVPAPGLEISVATVHRAGRGEGSEERYILALRTLGEEKRREGGGAGLTRVSCESIVVVADSCKVRVYIGFKGYDCGVQAQRSVSKHRDTCAILGQLGHMSFLRGKIQNSLLLLYLYNPKFTPIWCGRSNW